MLADARLTGASNEMLIKSLTRFYKLLGAAAKTQAAPGKGAGQGPGQVRGGSQLQAARDGAW